MRAGALSYVAAALASASHACAQTANPDPCPPQNYRWLEDCRALATADRRGFDHLRYVPVADERAWLTLGGEYRLRVEALSAVDFGVVDGPGSLTVNRRVYLHADLRTRAGPRAFVQLSAGASDGREPRPLPFDRSGPDIAQAFVDLPVTLGEVTVQARLGRQELSLDGNRLVQVRDGGNLRRAFEGARVDLRSGRLRIAAFAVRPVQNRDGAFDDRSDPGDRFAGATVDLAPAGMARSGVGMFLLARVLDRATYLDAAGRDDRRTLGLRWSWTDGRADAASQGALQWGQVGGQDVEAYSGTVDFGMHFPRERWQPRVGIALGVASGDRRRDDGRINSFDPLFPNPTYYSAAPLGFPSNIASIEANMTARPEAAITLRAATTTFLRTSNTDAVYAPPGRPATLGGNDRFIAQLFEIGMRATLGRHGEVRAAFVHAATGAAIDNAGGRDTSFALVQVTVRF